jgi:hypothetical protein
MADSDSTPCRHLPHGMDKLPPDFHAVDTRPEGARESVTNMRPHIPPPASYSICGI